MCIRITQFGKGVDYAAVLGWPAMPADALLDAEVPGFNLAPGAMLRAFVHDTRAGAPRMKRIRWGLTPVDDSAQPPSHHVNQRVETASSDPTLARLWRHGRCLVPVEGWYEWQVDQGRELPFRIHLPNDAPMFLAAITDRDANGDDGLILVTAQAGNGLLNAQDNRPVVLADEDALAWLAPSTSPDEARLIAMEMLLPPPAFQWHPVTSAIKDVNFDSAEALQPVEHLSA